MIDSSINVIVACLRSPTEDTPVNVNKLQEPFKSLTDIKGDIVLLRINAEGVPEDFTKEEWERFFAQDISPPEGEEVLKASDVQGSDDVQLEDLEEEDEAEDEDYILEDEEEEEDEDRGEDEEMDTGAKKVEATSSADADKMVEDTRS